MTDGSLNIRDYLSFGRNEHSICFAIKTVACEGGVMAKNEKTGPKAAKAASSVLKDGRTGPKSKTAAGSALSQAPDKGKKKK
jgi:hypothetical protein